MESQRTTAALPYITALPYHDAAVDFAPWAFEPHSFFLDSSLYIGESEGCGTAPGGLAAGGRYSFWGASPSSTWESREGFITVDDHIQIDSPAKSLKKFYNRTCRAAHDPYLPFSGGLVGFLSYEWGAALENVEAPPHKQDLFMPDGWFGFYETVVIYDHLEKTCRVVSPSVEAADAFAQKIFSLRKKGVGPLAGTPRASVGHFLELRHSLDKNSYLAAVRRILAYLKAGDCYQVNLTQRFMAPLSISAWELYAKLRAVSPAPYAAYINGGTFQILSASPELFLEAKADGTLTTKPIKGTRARGQTEAEDQRLKVELEQSQKDNAELLMITDLERNDLGRVCEPGSVKVPELKKLESFPQVHHLHSTVTGKRRKEFNIIDCLAATLPGGSITGAPKIRAMEIIRELEPVPRGIYTGVLGWLGPANTCHFNIAIRTMIVQDATCFFHAGGGIVIDSDPEAEHEEILTKAKGMLQALDG